MFRFGAGQKNSAVIGIARLIAQTIIKTERLERGVDFVKDILFFFAQFVGDVLKNHPRQSGGVQRLIFVVSDINADREIRVVSDYPVGVFSRTGFRGKGVRGAVIA